MNLLLFLFLYLYVCMYSIFKMNHINIHKNRNQKLKLIFLSQFVIFKIENLKSKSKLEIGVSFFKLNRKNRKQKKRGWFFHPLFINLIRKLPFKFFLMPCGCVRPFSEVSYFPMVTPANNGVIALQLVHSIPMVNDMSLSVETLARVIDGLQFVEFHYHLPPKFYFCFFLFLSIDIIAYHNNFVKKYF